MSISDIICVTIYKKRKELIMDRLKKQMEFLMEIDKMKNVLRRTILIDGSRRETDAEHSWHLAVMAMILYEYCDNSQVDLTRVLKMALVHDLVEVYAGDTFAFDVEGYKDKDEREQKAAVKIFGMLPDDQSKEYKTLWEEFEEMNTPDAMYTAAIDRLQPFVINYLTQGHTWALGNVSSKQVYTRIGVVKDIIPQLWDYVEFIINDSIEKGFLKR